MANHIVKGVSWPVNAQLEILDAHPLGPASRFPGFVAEGEAVLPLRQVSEEGLIFVGFLAAEEHHVSLVDIVHVEGDDGRLGTFPLPGGARLVGHQGDGDLSIALHVDLAFVGRVSSIEKPLWGGLSLFLRYAGKGNASQKAEEQSSE